MRDLAGETDFAAELIELGLVLGYRFGQELQRDRLPQLQVVGPVDLTHPSLPQL